MSGAAQAREKQPRKTKGWLQLTREDREKRARQRTKTAKRMGEVIAQMELLRREADGWMRGETPGSPMYLAWASLDLQAAQAIRSLRWARGDREEPAPDEPLHDSALKLITAIMKERE